MNESQDAVAPVPTEAIVKTVRVPLTAERAFELFTERMVEWWPLGTHSVGGAEAEGVVLEGRLGGRIVERLRDGTTTVWGTVTRWEPPRAVAFTWHPGRGDDESTDVSVAFVESDGGCEVVLVHTGWARRRDDEVRASYVTGWDHVLGRLVAAA